MALTHFSLIPLASINLATGPTANVSFVVNPPVACQFAFIEASQFTASSTTGYILATVAKNGTTLATGPTLLAAGTAAARHVRRVLAKIPKRSDGLVGRDAQVLNALLGWLDDQFLRTKRAGGLELGEPIESQYQAENVPWDEK